VSILLMEKVRNRFFFSSGVHTFIFPRSQSLQLQLQGIHNIDHGIIYV